MRVGDVIRFQEERFFNGAVQLGWVQQQPQLAAEVASAFVFHGPRYHGVDRLGGEDMQGAYRLKDTATFVLDLLRATNAARAGTDINPFLLAIAGYGSGKSHLSVTLAEMLSDPDGPIAERVIEQLRHADGAIADEAGGLLRALGKPMLVLPVDGSGRFHLGTALSQTVFAQLARAGVSDDAVRALSPRFEAAAQFVERNYGFRTESFAKQLPGRDLAAIRTALEEQDEDVFDAVNAVYGEANGHTIPIEGQESSQALLETLATSYCGEHGAFSHVLILFDELGLYLEHAAEHSERAGARALQEIFQGVQDNKSRIHFVGFIQYELKSYLQRFGSADLRHLQRYLTRFDGAEKAYLSTNLETLFAHLIHKDEAALDDLWHDADGERLARTTWQRLSACLPGLEKTPLWSDSERFTRVIARGCWPLHPLAVWLLTHQSDLIQQRSALAFVRQVTGELSAQEALSAGKLRQVSAADLLLDHMLEQFAAGDRVPGGAVETLIHLLDKHKARLDRSMRLTMSAIAALDKLQVGRQSREAMNALLVEATALSPSAIAADLDALAEMGALEWNADLEQYELLSDGASRGQFQRWLRGQVSQITRAEVRNLFVRRGVSDCGLMNPITSDFGVRAQISTLDWCFEASMAHRDTIDQAIGQAFEASHKARLPDAAKGRLIYLYLDDQDDPLDADKRIAAACATGLAHSGAEVAPIWVVAVTDSHGHIGDALARLAVIDERASAGDQNSFGRFIDDERGRIRERLRSATDDAIRERRYWVAGLVEPPKVPLRKAALAQFEKIYPRALPFPFDGFSTASGNGPRDVATIAKALVLGEVSQAWIPSQPTSRRNRIQAVLRDSWQALDDTNVPCVPRESGLRAVYKALQTAHETNPERPLQLSYDTLISAPYGMNTASATLFLALLIGLRSPQRGLFLDGSPINPADWIEVAFPRGRAKRYLDDSALARTRLRFFDEDAEARWRRFLEEWELETRVDRIARHGAEAAKRLKIEPIPPLLAERMVRLQLAAESANTQFLKMTARLKDLERQVEKAVTETSVHHCLKYGHDIAQMRGELSEGDRWPPEIVRECDQLLRFSTEVIEGEAAGWIKRQIVHSVVHASKFRDRTEAEARWLRGLGYAREAVELEHQALHALHHVEERQLYSLTLAEAQDYPRQPTPRGGEPIVVLRDEERKGLEIIKAMRAIASLAEGERQALVSAVERRIGQVQTVIHEQEARLGAIYALHIRSEEDLREAIAAIEHLRTIFAGDRNEPATNELARQLQRVERDLDSWERADLPPERLEAVLGDQAKRQLEAFAVFIESEEMDPPPWDLEALYGHLVGERVNLAKQRSGEWLRLRVDMEPGIQRLDIDRAQQLKAELAAGPGYLADSDRDALERLRGLLDARFADLEEQQHRARLAAWRTRFPCLGAVAALDRVRIEGLLAELQDPPVALGPEEHAWRDALMGQLTGRLDELSLDDLVGRIQRLSSGLRARLLERLAALT